MIERVERKRNNRATYIFAGGGGGDGAAVCGGRDGAGVPGVLRHAAHAAAHAQRDGHARHVRVRQPAAVAARDVPAEPPGSVSAYSIGSLVHGAKLAIWRCRDGSDDHAGVSVRCENGQMWMQERERGCMEKGREIIRITRARGESVLCVLACCWRCKGPSQYSMEKANNCRNAEHETGNERTEGGRRS